MAQAEQVDVLILGSGPGGKLLAWHLANAEHRTTVELFARVEHSP